ncbi:MAG: sodium/proline symporter [Eubacteriales bacterium]|nr:sodium/proline symporter [Eubacteriales bacterium]
MSSQICILLTIIVYLIGMLYVGFHFSRRNKTTDDFYLGGRKLGPFVVAMSAEASDMSSWLLMGVPGLAYLSGVCDAGWTVIGLALGTYLNWLFVARKIRLYTHATHSITLPSFFSNRYGDNKNILAGIAAVIIIIFFIPYTASGFAACGKLFNSIFGVDYTVAMILCAIVIILYCAMGGFMAASTTDLIQSIVMSIALISIVFYGVHAAGGLDNVMENAKSLPGYLSLSQTYSVETGTAQAYGLLTTFSMLAWGLGYFGMPHILLRFMAIEDENKLKLSRRIATIWVVIAMAIAIFIGIIGNAISKAGILDVLNGSDSETIIVRIAGLISQHGVLAAILAGIILAGILAATMSTSDSQLLTAASGVSENIFHDILHVELDEKKNLLVARATLIVIAIIGVFLARDPNSSVFQIVSFAWAGFGAAFGPVVLLALFWKRSNMYGALCGMVAGGAMIFIWKYGIATLGGVFAIYELLPAFLVALVVNVVVSLVTPAPSKEVIDTFDAVKKM